jgi:acetyl esterase
MPAKEQSAVKNRAKEIPSDVLPAIAQILKFLRERPGDKRPIDQLTPSEARARSRELWTGYWNATVPWISTVRDATISIKNGSVPIRVYDPGSSGNGPIFYFHGGGFAVGDLDTHDGITRRVSLYSGSPVISVGYRRAPEHPYPIPLDDCVAVVTAIASGQVDVGIDGSYFALSGDSAGANLALACALRLRDEGGCKPIALGLIFGCYDPVLATDSVLRYGGGEYNLSERDLRWYWRQYLGEALSNPPSYAAPLHVDLSKLPPSLIAVAACDPLYDENLLLAKTLRVAGVVNELRVWDGMVHGCIGWARSLNQADQQLAQIAVWLADHLSNKATQRVRTPT